MEKLQTEHVMHVQQIAMHALILRAALIARIIPWPMELQLDYLILPVCVYRLALLTHCLMRHWNNAINVPITVQVAISRLIIAQVVMNPTVCFSILVIKQVAACTHAQMDTILMEKTVSSVMRAVSSANF
jgi:hypothetical protein